VIAIILVSIFLSSCLVFPAQAYDCPVDILKVSLPAGTIIGPNATDPWLNEGWLLNLTGPVQTFTVRINNTSSSKRSYDTHFVIALNDAGYNNLVSLVAYSITVPKSAFRSGRPKPYNKWTWLDDVYPTRFNDTRVNVGTISRGGYKDVVVSVQFSSPNGVRMHFDAWGKTTQYSPSVDQITYDPNSKDSTVLLCAGPPPPPQPPHAAFFFGPSYPTSGDTVTFNATASYDPDGYIASYQWNFGDGSPTVIESDPIITHAYSTYGNYNVTLKVTDNSSLTSYTWSIVSVRQRPVASFDFTPPDPLMHELVVFDASSSTPDGGTLVRYEWDFGDGSPKVIETDHLTNHTYNSYGTYTVTLNVTDSEGKWDTESKPITVEKCPVADFYWTPDWPQQGETVIFDASSSTPDGGVIVYYEWDFGDGSPHVLEFDPITNHIYSSHGTYMVTLNVTDSECRSDIRSDYISIRANPCASFTWSPPSPLRGQTVTFDGSSSTPDGGTLVSYTWNFGDGTPLVTEYDPITTHVYTSSGDFTVTLNVTDSEDKWDIESKIIGIGIPQYYLTVQTAPPGIITIPGEGWYYESTNVTLTAPAYVPINSTVRYRFDYWDVDSISKGSNVNPIYVIMDADHTATAHFVIQYKVIFDHTGLSSDATGTVVTVDMEAKTFGDLPFDKWVDTGSTVTYLYNTIVLSTVSGKRYRLDSVTGPSSPIFVAGPVTVTGNYVIQYYITFGQTGVGTDFTGIVVTVDLMGYDRNGVSFWWDNGTVHSFSFASPLVVNPSKQYYWIYTSGLSSVQSGPLTVTTSGSVTGNYASLLKYQITFDQTGVGIDFGGTVVIVDGNSYSRANLPKSFLWDTGSNHTFSFQSPLDVTPNVKRYVWSSTTGLSSAQSGYIIVSTSGSIIGHYDTRYTVTFAQTGLSSDAAGTIVTVDGSSKTFGVLPYMKWVDSGSLVNYAYTSIVSSSTPGKRYRLNSVTGPTSPINVASAVTATGNYVTQYSVTFTQTGLDSSATGTVATVDSGGKTFSDLPHVIWVDNSSSVSYSYSSTVSSTTAGKRFKLINVIGPPSTIFVTSPVTVTGNYKTQYRFNVPTAPLGLSPEPTRNPPGEPGSWWYDSSTSVVLTAQPITGYTFQYWDVDGTSQGNGVNPITVHMNAPHTATAHYQVAAPPPPSVGGYATPIDSNPSSVPLVDFAHVLTAMIIAAAIVIADVLTKHRILGFQKKT
jgi:PKD repeat protein